MEGVFLLEKRYRWRKNRDFKKVYQDKNSVAAGSGVLYSKNNGNGAEPRVGFSVSKRIGNAVLRNRCRRRLREAVRACLPSLRPGWDYVFIVRQSMAAASWEKITGDVRRALERGGARMKKVRTDEVGIGQAD
jgi:ribonuclease P protein component